MLRRQEVWQQIAAVCAAVGPNQIDALANAVIQRFKESGGVQEQVPGRDEKIRNSEEEQEQGGASQQVALPTPGGFIQDAPASSFELDFPLVRGVPVEGGSARRSGTQGDRKRGTPWVKERMTIWEDWCFKQKKKEKQPGKGPKNL